MTSNNIWMKYATPEELERYELLTVRGKRKVAIVNSEITKQKYKIRRRATSRRRRAKQKNERKQDE